MNDRGIVLFAHGSREPGWVLPFERMRERVAAALGDRAVRLAYLEHAQPPLAQAVAELFAAGIRRVNVVPLFLATGGHLKRDLPRMLAEIVQSHPGLALEATPPLGDIDAVQEAIADWIVKKHTPR